MGTIKKFSIPIILINAVYFLAQWALPFDVKATKETPFFASEGNSIQVSFYSKIRFFCLIFFFYLQIMKKGKHGFAHND